MSHGINSIIHLIHEIMSLSTCCTRPT